MLYAKLSKKDSETALEEFKKKSAKIFKDLTNDKYGQFYIYQGKASDLKLDICKKWGDNVSSPRYKEENSKLWWVLHNYWCSLDEKDEVEEIRGGKGTIIKDYDSLSDKQREQMDRDELNICDKCNVVESTYELVWISSEDFTPFEGEVVPQSVYDKYDCLCDQCYRGCLK